MTSPMIRGFEVSKAEPHFYDDKTTFSVSVACDFGRMSAP